MINNFFIFYSKHFHLFWLGAYPTNTHFISLGSSLLKMFSGFLIKTVQPNTFKGMLENNLDLGNSYWILLRAILNFKSIESIIFIRCTAFNTSSHRNYVSTLFENICRWVTSRMCLLFLSSTQFCHGVLLQELCCAISFSSRYFSNTFVKYSLPLSLRSIWICTWTYLWIII